MKQYVIILKTGIVFYPHNRARYNKLVCTRRKQIASHFILNKVGDFKLKTAKP